MNVNYVLLATGSALLPRINHSFLDYSSKEIVESHAELVAAALSKAGYFNFALYDVSTDEHKIVAEYKVEIPEPVVTKNLK